MDAYAEVMPHASQDPDFERIMERSGQFEAARAAWPQFLVVRLGRDDANQPDRDRQPLGFVPAPDAAGATTAAEEKWSLFTGQQFEVCHASKPRPKTSHQWSAWMNGNSRADANRVLGCIPGGSTTCRNKVGPS